MNINPEIRKEKRSLRKSVSIVNQLLSRSPHAKARFNQIISEHKKRGHYMGADEEESSWYESKFVTDLFDLGTSVVKSNTIGKNESRQLELELEKIQATNKSLDKQLSLQSALSRGGAYGGSFIDELFNSPIKLAGIAGLVGFFIYSRKKR